MDLNNLFDKNQMSPLFLVNSKSQGVEPNLNCKPVKIAIFQ